MLCEDLVFASVVAIDRAWCIGKDGTIPWHLPSDLKHFKKLTMGGRIIMGRHTHESIGRALPGRENIVLSSRPDYAPAQGCLHHQSIASLCEQLCEAKPLPNFIIGGARVYDDFLPLVSTIHLTVVDTIVEKGDTFLSPLDATNWEVVSSTEHEADDRHAHRFVMHELRRVKRAPEVHFDEGKRQAVSEVVPKQWLP